MKILIRLLKYVILPLVLLVIIVLWYISIGFNRLEFKDDFSVDSNYSFYYPESYESARKNFSVISQIAEQTYENVKTFRIQVPSTSDSDLTMDVCYIPAQQDSLNLLILSSGVHGVEGYTGHAVQWFFAENYLDHALLKNTGVLLIHAVNPYGFKYTRRVSEYNIDLNRNSPSTDGLYSTENRGYRQVYDLINPQKKVRRFSLENRFFFVKAINEIRKASLPVLRQAVLQGQYEFKEGLYFGGNRTEPQIDSLRPLLKTITDPYQKIKLIDLHTGYGERGRLHLFPNPMEGEERQRLESLYDGFSIDWGDSDDFYTITGDFAGFVGHIVGERVYYPMVFEYGTLNSQTTMGSLKSIHIMILENQGHQHGFASEQDSLRVKKDLMEMYYPSSQNWRNYILEQTRDVFDVVLPRFAEN